MSDDAMAMRDEDRLPWLEAVEEEEPEGIGLGRLLLWAGGGLALIALIVFAVMFFMRGGEQPDGELIRAPEESYRVPPEDAGGMEVEGEGDAAFAASEGQSPDGRIDPDAVPEEPVAGRRAAAVEAQPAPDAGSSAVIEDGDGGDQAAPARPAPATPSLPVTANGGVIQLGAFSSEAAANRAWRTLSGRYDYLEPLTMSVTPVETGGRTLYRLRAAASSPGAARTVCNRLRVATEACTIVAN